MALPKINTPTYTVKIPSSGKMIEYRPFSVKEQKTLMLAKESNDVQSMVRATKDLIASCTFEEINAADLAIFDFEYLFLKIRAKSVGETSDIQIKCKNCDEFVPLTINVDEVEVVGDIEKDKKLQLTDNIGIKLRYPSFENSISLLGSDKEETEMVYDLILDCIEMIYDENEVYPVEDSTRQELVEFVDSLSTRQFQNITEFFDTSPMVSLDADANCGKCEHSEKITITGLKNFF